MYFGLREKQPHHHAYQHNILYKLSTRLRRRNLGDAAYICPLFLDRAAYRMNVYLSALAHRLRFWEDYPYHLEDLNLNHSTGTISLEQVPILAEHLCIRPHCTVTDAKHSYSFSEDGGDVCFHSPLSLPNGGKPLGRWLSGAWNAFAEMDPGHRITRHTALASLRELTEPYEDDGPIEFPAEILESDDGIEAWHRFGDFLQREHQIDQYAIVAWRP